MWCKPNSDVEANLRKLRQLYAKYNQTLTLRALVYGTEQRTLYDTIEELSILLLDGIEWSLFP